jgi:hypothetical protein
MASSTKPLLKQNRAAGERGITRPTILPPAARARSERASFSCQWCLDWADTEMMFQLSGRRAATVMSIMTCCV